VRVGILFAMAFYGAIIAGLAWLVYVLLKHFGVI